MAVKQEMQDTVARALCRDNDLEPCTFCTIQARLAVAALVLAGYVQVDIEDLIEASSLGTPGAKALRDSVSDEQVQRVLDVADRVRGGQRAVDIAYQVAPDDHDYEPRGGRLIPKTDGGAVEPPATPRAVPDPAARAGEASWRPAPSSPIPRPWLFELYRHRDVTGKSGTGVVAWGALWPDSTVSLRWAGATPSFSNWDSLDVLMDVHGHEGATELRWLDGES